MAKAFFNSFLRENSTFTWQGDQLIDIPLSANKGLLVGISWRSYLGRHRYTGSFFLVENGRQQGISFLTAATELLLSLATKNSLKVESVDHFILRLKDSLANVEKAKEFWSRQSDFEEALYDFLKMESSLIYGHSFHPTPKSKGGMTELEKEQYCPEFGHGMALCWYRCKKSILRQEKATLAEQHGSHQLALWDLPASTQTLAVDEAFVPLHPYQEKELLSGTIFSELVADGLAAKVGPGKHLWYATSSVRTLFSPGSPYQLKFSLGIKLTNSERYLSVAEASRGLMFYDLLHHDTLNEFHERHPSFEVVHEPSYFGIKGPNGRVIPAGLVSFRENILGTKSQGTLATLTQFIDASGHSPLGFIVRNLAEKRGMSLRAATKDIYHGLLDHYLFPLLDLAVNYGICGSAHAQNIVVEFDNHYPVKCYFRDCQGTWIDPVTHKKMIPHISLLASDGCLVIGEDESAVLFTYYCVINATFNLVTALGALSDVSEKELLRDLRSRLAVFFYKNSHKLGDYLLNEKTWLYKGNFNCTLKNLDEVSQTDPLAIYGPLANPLYQNSPENLVIKVAPPLLASPFEVSFSHGRCDVYFDSVRILCFTWNDIKELFIKLEYVSKDSPDASLGAVAGLFLVFGKIRSLTSCKLCDGMVDLLNRLKIGLSNHLPIVSRVDIESYRPLYMYGGSDQQAASTSSDFPRKDLPSGVVYRRYQPLSNTTLSIETFSINKHLDLFYDWHQKKRIADIWELNKPKAALKSYIKALHVAPYVHPVILNYDGVPAGYFEIYWCREDRLAPYYDVDLYDRGMHLLIGDDRYLGFENTFTAWVALQHFIFLDESKTESVMLEPRADNQRLLKYLAVLDNVTVEKEFDFPHKRAKLVRCRREGFFKGAYL